MSRATLLPSPGDPFLISYWLQNYRHWAGYGGVLYLQVAWPQPPEVLERIREDVLAAAPEAVVLEPPAAGFLDHGQAMHALLERCEEEVVQFSEDDLYVRAPQAIERWFGLVERGDVDVVGSPRGSMSNELAYARAEDTRRPGLWPHLLFGRKETFNDLSEPFGARIWQPGERVAGLEHVCAELASADTFCAAAMELRARLRLLPIPSPGAHPWEREPETLHIGSLSSGPLPHAVRDVRPQPEGWGQRISWWRRCAQHWPGGLEALHARYREAVDELVAANLEAVSSTDVYLNSLVNW